MKKLRELVRNLAHFMRDLITLARLLTEVASFVQS